MATSQQSISRPVGIAPADLKRIARVTQRVERSKPSGSRPIYDRARWFATASPGAIRTGIVSTTITARSGTTLGTGAVTLCLTDPTAGTETVSTDPADVLTVKNSFAVAFAPDSNSRCKVHYEAGCWKILTREC